MLGLVPALATPAAADSPTGAGNGDGPQLDVELVADGLVAPLGLTFALDGSERRFIVDQTGLVLILTPEGNVLPAPFLDITDQVVLQSAFDERGLLELAFHPQFARNGKLYVQYSAQRKGENICVDENGFVPADPDGCPFQYTRRVSEFMVAPTDSNRVDPRTERVVFEIQWPGRKHNGGGLAFGPDGMLYIGLGDAGFVHGPSGSDDPFNVDPDLLFGDRFAQDLTPLYGKILRIDVDRGEPYAIPPDNPFAGADGIPDEIYAWGFRNPFRISFDREHDRAMYVSATADTLFEATYKVAGPGNFGWAIKEGTHCFDRTSAFSPPDTCPAVGPLGEPIHDPIIEYLNFAVEDPRSQRSLVARSERGRTQPRDARCGRIAQATSANLETPAHPIAARTAATSCRSARPSTCRPARAATTASGRRRREKTRATTRTRTAEPARACAPGARRQRRRRARCARDPVQDTEARSGWGLGVRGRCERISCRSHRRRPW
jgi:glucose/arabinose dehydrogenase